MNYAQTAKNVDKQLTKAGQQITVSRKRPVRNPQTGAVNPGLAVSASAAAVEVPVTQQLMGTFAITLEPGALVQKTVRAFKVSALLGFQPEPQDTVTLADGSQWPVIGCTPINPAGIPLVYTVGVAK